MKPIEDMSLSELFAAADAIPDHRTEAEKQAPQQSVLPVTYDELFAEMDGTLNDLAVLIDRMGG